jgi:hypothetical protein
MAKEPKKKDKDGSGALVIPIEQFRHSRDQVSALLFSFLKSAIVDGDALASPLSRCALPSTSSKASFSARRAV